MRREEFIERRNKKEKKKEDGNPPGDFTQSWKLRPHQLVA